jgi:type II secretory pathway pseudopilin PulG
MIGTGLAILGSGLLGAGASMYGASKAADAQKEAANQAAAVQAKGQADALAFQKDVYGNQKQNFEDTKGYLSPYVNNGGNASNLLAEAYGLSGKTALGQNSLQAFQNSPDYQWALKGGSEALDNSAAAKGGALGGNQIRAQTEYGQGLATQNLQNYFQRLSGMAGQGIQAGGMLGQIGSTLGNGLVGANAAANITGSNNQAQSIMGAGTAEASGISGCQGLQERIEFAVAV